MTTARTVYRIEAHAGERRLDAYVIPPDVPSRAPPSPAARYAGLDPAADQPVQVGLDLSGEEDFSAIWTRHEPEAARRWREAARATFGRPA